MMPSMQPSVQPSSTPSSQPSSLPLTYPSSQPSTRPSTQPTDLPSSLPTTQPTCQPSLRPSIQPSSSPSTQPSSIPSASPTNTFQPSVQPTYQIAPSVKFSSKLSMSFPADTTSLDKASVTTICKTTLAGLQVSEGATCTYLGIEKVLRRLLMRSGRYLRGERYGNMGEASPTQLHSQRIGGKNGVNERDLLREKDEEEEEDSMAIASIAAIMAERIPAATASIASTKSSATSTISAKLTAKPELIASTQLVPLRHNHFHILESATFKVNLELTVNMDRYPAYSDPDEFYSAITANLELSVSSGSFQETLLLNAEEEGATFLSANATILGVENGELEIIIPASADALSSATLFTAPIIAGIAIGGFVILVLVAFLSYAYVQRKDKVRDHFYISMQSLFEHSALDLQPRF
jgi:hypothetical protein